MGKTISKWFFFNFHENINNLRYLRTIPFIVFSNLKSTNYDLIGKILDKISLNRELLISIGENKAPYGVTVNPKNDKELNVLLNSAKYSFILTDRQNETNYLLKLILAGVIPICSNHMDELLIKKLGLKDFTSAPNYDKVLSKLCEIKRKQKIFDYKIALLSWKSNRQLIKWNKTEK